MAKGLVAVGAALLFLGIVVAEVYDVAGQLPPSYPSSLSEMNIYNLPEGSHARRLLGGMGTNFEEMVNATLAEIEDARSLLNQTIHDLNQAKHDEDVLLRAIGNDLERYRLDFVDARKDFLEKWNLYLSASHNHTAQVDLVAELQAALTKAQQARSLFAYEFNNAEISRSERHAVLDVEIDRLNKTLIVLKHYDLFDTNMESSREVQRRFDTFTEEKASLTEASAADAVEQARLTEVVTNATLIYNLENAKVQGLDDLRNSTYWDAHFANLTMGAMGKRLQYQSINLTEAQFAYMASQADRTTTVVQAQKVLDDILMDLRTSGSSGEALSLKDGAYASIPALDFSGSFMLESWVYFDVSESLITSPPVIAQKRNRYFVENERKMYDIDDVVEDGRESSFAFLLELREYKAPLGIPPPAQDKRSAGSFSYPYADNTTPRSFAFQWTMGTTQPGRDAAVSLISDPFVPRGWNHIAVGINASGHATLLVNGALEASQEVVLPRHNSPEAILLNNAARLHTPVRYGDGKFDELRVWNSPKSEADVAANMRTVIVGIEAGLVRSYPMDEPLTADLRLVDRSPDRADGIAFGTASFVYSRAFYNDAVISEGTKNGVRLHGSATNFVQLPPQDFTSSFSLEVWMYRDSEDNAYHMPKLLQRSREEGGIAASYVFSLELRRGGGIGMEGEDPTTGRWVFEMGNGADIVLFLKSDSFNIFDSTSYGWQNLQVTVNRNGESALYVNGTLADAAFVSNDRLKSDFAIEAGRRIDENGDTSYFAGGIDELRIWDHARTSHELALYRRFLLSGDESGLLAYYRFNEPEVRKEIIDRTGQFHGVLRGPREAVPGPY
eukprot:CAMPEP_0113894290 /NCGR_PEP_ID=MMETSP0780_2-20120614/16627_1 /TAXON_ID=652834 /ORGANISM="Palpitomonas bilix" /LENGTH=841 /DNA_ID=CAMNT_0000884797 /DNA_START=14 /DNA_END=2539 /DNA_ORIENTATION=+ /assembly_acc=CAM_ASM_000599